MAEGYKSALIASLRGDAPQGPRMGSGINPLMFDWMNSSNVPLSFAARRTALLNPERLALPLPATRPMPTGGYEDSPIPDEPPNKDPNLGPPVARKPSNEVGETPLPPPPPEPPPELPDVAPEEEEEEEEAPPTSVNVLPVNAGDDIFADDYIPAEEVVIPDVPEEEQEEDEEQEPVFDLVVEGPIEQPIIEEPNFVEPGPIDFQPPDPILEENIRDWTEPKGEITIDELDLIDPGPVDFVNIPLRDYGSDLGTTVIEGAFDPTLGGIFDPGSEIISPISGPNNPYENPFIGLSPQQLNELLFGGP